MGIFARKLDSKTAVDRNGSVVGELHNVTINFNSGSLRSLLINPNGSPTEQQRHKSKYKVDDQGRYIVPAESVSSVGDQIVLE